MNLLRTFLALVLLCATSAFSHAAEKSPGVESLGKITEGQKADATLQILGKPESKGADTFMGATGEWMQEWRYPAQGLRLYMASNTKNGAKTVSTITASGDCKLATRRGIRIGDSVAAVRKAYGKFEDKSQGRSGETFVAGSVYGGVIMT